MGPLAVVLMLAAVALGGGQEVAGTQAALQRGGGRYDIFPVRATILREQVLGPARSGVACLPAGKVRWSDVPWQPDAAAREVAAALVRTGVAAGAPDPALTGVTAPGSFQVSVEIVALTASVCRPRYNMLKLSGTALKAQGTMSVRWQVTDAATQRVVLDRTTTAEFDFKSRDKSLALLIDAGLAQNVAIIAPGGQ